MKVVRVRSWSQKTVLLRPYRIAYAATDSADLSLVELVDDGGESGLGAAAPVEEITGESATACAAALTPDRLEWLIGREVDDHRDHCPTLAATYAVTPAARAAIDMALHDLSARRRGIPLVELLGRVHDSLPTSITIGMKPEAETLAEAAEYVGRGFRFLKIKIGADLDSSVQLLDRVRHAVPRHVRIRVDANKSLTIDQTIRLGGLVDRLGIELIEQPLDPSRDSDLRAIPAAMRRRIVLDESVRTESDARALAANAVAGVFNVKLMKCGGIAPALAIAEIGRRSRIEIMWGCMDESVIGIAAALHAAYASPATRFLDLDGSLDLARDPASGGFTLTDGCMRTLPDPGLGCRLLA